MTSNFLRNLSDEQEHFIQVALSSEKNILVDACIGSGKTTEIQEFCKRTINKKILYLTYNNLLKVDAKNKIINNNVTVQNYHGFAYLMLRSIGKTVGQSDLIQAFITEKNITIPYYDILILDEYQDIDQEISELLYRIKMSNSTIKIIAVGDMEQKIYDRTSLDVLDFMRDFLGEYTKLTFTKCFRLGNDIASKLGRIWHKQIIGVNENCQVEKMNYKEVLKFLSRQKPQDILCLGGNKGQRDELLNDLEMRFPKKFNKNTVYAKISEYESIRSIRPKHNSAIFTTFDSSKGLEKKICVICDFSKRYWEMRNRKPNVRYEILRNIFCVAASRGKEKIIFMKDSKGDILSEEILSTFIKNDNNFRMFDMSDMFEFKYKEDIDECFNHLTIEKIDLKDNSEIPINCNDGLIDLSPCIDIYQEAIFFRNYDIDETIKQILLINELKMKSDNDFMTPESEIKKRIDKKFENDCEYLTLDQKILYLTSLIVKQKDIKHKLRTLFDGNETIQVECKLHFAYQKGGYNEFIASGFADVIKNNIVYKLKYVQNLAHEHFLQCASFAVALQLKEGILWNTRDNTIYRITIPNRKKFLDCVTKAITKGVIKEYHKPCYVRFQFKNDVLISVTDTKTINDYRNNRL
ncbi:hypothetical protein PIROE2DRAFT_4017 [Piromyces sp. E2]|nr:hypothetical protein PIROE2DRAFT_4017 [Piromyces sp. E2]|eukprot:OUM68275.1 hypothetical protein PIROE2DRAFT_4017 [Piromyces sp. E2]